MYCPLTILLLLNGYLRYIHQTSKLKKPQKQIVRHLFLDLHLEFDSSGKLSTKIYDKRDDFNFKIINFPYLCSNIPSSPAYGVYVSQLIRYARACTNYSDFLERHKNLRTRLLSQEYEEMRLKKSLTKFFFKYQFLVEKYSVSSKTILEDCFL